MANIKYLSYKGLTEYKNLMDEVIAGKQNAFGQVEVATSAGSNAKKYIKFATITLTKAWESCCGSLFFTPTESLSAVNGVLHYFFRSASTSAISANSLDWQYLTNYDYVNSVVAVKTTDNSVDLYYKPINTYDKALVTNVICDNPHLFKMVKSTSYVNSVTPFTTSYLGSRVSNANLADKAYAIAKSGSETELTVDDIATVTQVSGVRTYAEGVQDNVDNGLTQVRSEFEAAFDGKANKNHTHSIDEVKDLQASLDAKAAVDHDHNNLYYTEGEVDAKLDAKVPTSRTVNGKSLADNIILSASDVGADADGTAATAEANAKSYTDIKIANLVNGAPTTLDTIAEIAAALNNDPNVVTALESSIGTKVDKTTTVNGHALGSDVTVTKSDVGLGNVNNVAALPLTGGTVTGTLVLSKTTDADGTLDASPALIVGGTVNQPHLELDGNEIMAKANGTTVSDLYINNNGGTVHINGFTLGKSVPADAKFTDTNTWRGIQDNLTSTSTTDSLSANQGKILNDKFASYVPTSRTVNNKPLSANVTLSASDIGISSVPIASIQALFN